MLRRILSFGAVALLWVLLSGVALVSLTVYGVWAYRHAILDRELTNLLRAPVRFKTARLDFLSEYPWTNIHIYEADIGSTNPRYRGAPFRLDSARLRLNLLDLLTQKNLKHIEYLELSGLRMDLVKDSFGTNNFVLFEHFDLKRPRPEFVKLDTLLFRNSRLDYLNQPAERHYAFDIDSAQLGLAILPTHMLVEVDGKGQANFWREGDFRFLENRPYHLASRMRYDKRLKNLELIDMGLQVNQADFKLDGQLPLDPNQPYDLTFGVPAGDIEALLNLLPDASGEVIRDFDPRGRYSFSGVILGVDNTERNPHIEVNFQANEASFRTRIPGLTLTELAFQGVYSNGDQNNTATTFIELPQLRGSLNGSPIAGRLTLRELTDPYLDMAGSADLALADFEGLRLFQRWGDPSGKLFARLSAAGRASDFGSIEAVDRLNFAGSFRMDSVGIAPRRFPVALNGLSGLIEVEELGIQITDLTGELNGIPLSVTGGSPSLVRYLLTDTARLVGQFQVDLANINLDTVLGRIENMVPAKEDSLRVEAKPAATATRTLSDWLAEPLPTRIQVDGQVRASHVNVSGLVFDSLHSRMRLHPKLLALDTFRLSRPDAHLALSLNLHDTTRQAEGMRELRAHIDWQSPNGQQWLTSLVDSTNVRLQATDGQLHAIAAWQPARPANTFTGRIALEDASAVFPVSPTLHFSALNAQLPVRYAHLAEGQQAPLELRQLTGALNGHAFTLAARLNSLHDPRFKAHLITEVSATFFDSLIKSPVLTLSGGQIGLNVGLSGDFRYLANKDSLLAWQPAGQIRLRGLDGHYGTKRPISFAGWYGKLGLAEEAYTLRYGSGFVDSTDLELTGTTYRLLSYLRDPSNRLAGAVRANSHRLDLSPYLQAPDLQAPDLQAPDLQAPDLQAPANSRSGSPAKPLNLQLPSHADFRLQYTASAVLAGNFRGDSLQVDLTLADSTLRVPTAKMGYGGGSVDVSGRVRQLPDTTFATEAEASLQDVSFSTLLGTFRNFNQQLIRSDNTTGRFFAEVAYRDTLPATWTPTFKRTTAVLDLRVVNGTLSNFEPLLMLRGLYRQDRLDTLRFYMQANNLLYSRDTLFIEPLRLATSLFDMELYGTHTLESQLDYYLYISTVQQRNRRVTLPSARWVTTQPTKSPLSVYITGSASDPRIRFDWWGATKRLAKQIVTE